MKYRGKPCRKCGETLRYLRNTGCVSCSKRTKQVRNATLEAKEAKRLREAKPEARRAKNARSAVRRTELKGIAGAIVAAAKQRSKGKRVFDLDPAMVEARVCEATGILFDLSPRGRGRMRPFAHCIDRIDSAGDYIPSNVQIVCNIYNVAKSDFSETDLLRMVRAVAEKRGWLSGALVERT